MSLPLFMTPSDIQKFIGMPEDTLWDCIYSGAIGYSEFKDVVLVDTSEIIDLIKIRKFVAHSSAYNYDDGYYEQDAVEIE